MANKPKNLTNPTKDLQAKLLEEYPGVTFSVRRVPCKGGHHMLSIRWTNPAVKRARVMAIAKLDFDGPIYGYYTREMN